MDCHYNNQKIEICNPVDKSTTNLLNSICSFSCNNSQIHTADKGHVKSKEIIIQIPPVAIITGHRRWGPCQKNQNDNNVRHSLNLELSFGFGRVRLDTTSPLQNDVIARKIREVKQVDASGLKPPQIPLCMVCFTIL